MDEKWKSASGKQRAQSNENLSSLRNVHKPTIQTISLSSTVPFLDYLMFYVSDSLSTRPINSSAKSLEAHKMCINLLSCVCRIFLTFDSMIYRFWGLRRKVSLSLSLVLECFCNSDSLILRFRSPENDTKRIEIVSAIKLLFGCCN
jgi:hypothetical protein